jgi:hypothetical protein
LLLSMTTMYSITPPRLLHFKAPRPNSMCIGVASISRLSPRCPTLARQAIMARDLKRMRTNGGRTLPTVPAATCSGIARVRKHGELPPGR